MLVCWWKLLFLSELWKILIFYNINKDVSNYIFYVETFYWIYLFSVFRWLKLYKKLTWNFVSKIRPLFSPWVCGMSDFFSKTLRRFLSKIKKLCRRQSMFSLLHARNLCESLSFADIGRSQINHVIFGFSKNEQNYRLSSGETLIHLGIRVPSR